ncbi:C2H2 type zinc finger transcription factor family [Perilla frutescens var. hirtella]|uniref:C2H2 type zinc finger transcription factor family n=1 Tax=Perilla frutescens var. hirtella TaxID=608512 RepID=A0AAD4JI43_PERFH|nr:C2H2 type zinc finger transcription factor family [Perilla frutescens var. hirtella]
MDHNEDDAAKSAAPSSKIPLIKIRLPKKMEEEAAAAAAAKAKAAEEVKGEHWCKECNRNFSSGKALGGHMSSAHVQANKDYSFKKLSSKKKPSSSYSGSNSNTCMMCLRDFQSKKSLFGHMRCHPERDWRGMEPPPDYKIHSSGEASSEDDQIDDVGFNLKSWPTSNKRGRGPLINSPAIRAPDSGSENKGSESFVAGLQLIKLLKGDSRKQENGPNNPDLEQQQQEETVVDEIESGGKGKEKLPENQDSDSGIDPNDELYITAIQVLVSGKRDYSNNEKRVAVVEEKPPAEIISPSPSPNPSPEKYKCNECGRLFPTHQALGGHRSSHNKFKMTIINTNEIRDSNPETQVKKKRKKKEKKTVKGGGGGGGFAFDLNMAPAEEDEEEEGESSNDHNTSAASLSNS